MSRLVPPNLPDALDALLPQTQCGECGFSGCRPYAEALARGEAPIDRCPPGGVQTLRALGQLLRVDPTPMETAMQANTRPPSVAQIREADCIGCTKCIQACPVDAIIGTGKHMHVVIPHECTGCGLCVAPCPVDCIEMLPLEAPRYDRDKARERATARRIRLDAASSQQVVPRNIPEDETSARKAYILAAMERVRRKKHEQHQTP